ncbi:hypothetical protein Golomagni_05814 [Golovinomyces magnicellulatus]|nr:hypothetical protein Golomagni_05814 [Golovinomyces magnicellulatus]
MVLPVSVIVFLFELGISLGGLVLAVVAVKWLAIALPIVIFALVGIQRFYVRTSKQLRILDLRIENKAPLFGHFLETINGLASIRAFNWTETYINKSFGLLDAAQKPWYLLNCIQRWLTLVMDLIVAALVVIMMGITISIRDKINPTLLGVALVQLMNLGMELKGLILQWSMLETSLGAVTRIKTFVEHTPSESLPGEDYTPAQGWLSQGTLEVQNVAIQYSLPTSELSRDANICSESAGPVVRNINFTVKHGQKVGLCGRSGSGKSSTIQALLRMADIAEGKIILDGQDITKIPRELIREKLSCLTQDPALFSNTVRFNADPMEEHSDVDIINALERVGIWSVIKAKTKEEEDPLDAKMTEDFLSHGQRQLFCLGRALLKHSSVLILDEPTSSVDGQTDAAIQSIIRSEFKDRTIIMIAHRLDTLLDFDKIAVLEKGALVEFDSPQNLLADTKSCFSALYRAETRPGSDSD